jgi:hypothetical protein
MAKTKSVQTESPKKGEIQVNFGNVEALKLGLLNDQAKKAQKTVDLLERIDATLTRLEGKYDANQEALSGRSE